MPNHTRRVIALATALLLSAVTAQAQGKGKDKGHDKGRDHGDERHVVGNQRNVPPGLAKKPGGMPPGQYKKHYTPSEGSSILRDILIGRGYNVVRTENAGSSRYVYYRLRDGAVRRAVVSPGSDQVTFGGLPSGIQADVMLRLR